MAVGFQLILGLCRGYNGGLGERLNSQWLPLPLLIFRPRFIAFWSPPPYVFPLPPLPSPSPSTTPPSNPVVIATCARGRGECEGRGEGEGPGWKLRNVSPFDLKGGVSWFNYLLSSLGNPIKTFCGAKFNMCVGGGGVRKAGAK